MSLRALGHVVRADLLERTRRTSFLVAAALLAMASFFFVPPAGAPYTIIDLGGFRGVYNAAWVGAMLTVLFADFFVLFGFYYVRGSISDDVRSGVGQLITATPTRRAIYLFGKWLSGWLRLSLLALGGTLMGLVMLLGRGEMRAFDLEGLFVPLVVLILPLLALSAACAVLFDVVRPLRGVVGSALFLFLFLAVASGAVISNRDLYGSGVLLSSIAAACADAYGAACAERPAVGLVALDGAPQLFTWPGMVWTPGLIVSQALWLGASLLIVGAALLLFRGFGADQELQGRADREAAAHGDTDGLGAPPVAAKPSPAVRGGNSFGRVLLAEVRLALRGRPWWWYAVAAGLIITSALAPMEVTLTWLLPIAWIWPLAIWSALGARERMYGTDAIVFTTPQPLLRQLPARWLAGVIVTALAGVGAAVALMLAGAGGGLFAWAATAALIPALALALGSWSGGPRLFEVLYLILWYAALNGVPGLAFVAAAVPESLVRLLFVALLLAATAARLRF
jgi:hypothetical protein